MAPGLQPGARPARPPAEEEEARISLSGYFYLVDLGPDARPRYHHVGKDRRCRCARGGRCPAVAAVARYLAAGGERAPDPPPGYFPVAPLRCPLCNSRVTVERRLSSKRRGAGWRCSRERDHYWQVQVEVLRRKLAANPWLFPPVVVRAGEQLYAYDGVQAGDRVLYPGVRREEVVTSST